MRPGSRCARRRPAAARSISDHPLSLGAVGATGASAANRLARDADLVIGIGTRWSDFTTASKSAFQDPGVRFVNVNVTAFDAAKHSGLPLLADARVALEQLRDALRGGASTTTGSAAPPSRSSGVGSRGAAPRVGAAGAAGSPPSQASIIGAINDAAGERGVVVCAAGSAPGDLHKLWRARDPPARATTSSTATRAWATRSPAESASSSPRPSARCTC